MKHFRAKPLRPVSPRPVFLVDHQGVRVAAPRNFFSPGLGAVTIVGFVNANDPSEVQPPSYLGGERLVFALATNVTGGNLSLRYRPPHPPGEGATFGMSFENVIAVGLGIAQGSLLIETNTVPPVDDASWVMQPVIVRGRALYANLSGGVSGTDYILTWTAEDTDSNVWVRSALCLCASTS